MLSGWKKKDRKADRKTAHGCEDNRLTKKESCILVGRDILLLMLLAYLFYDSWLALPPLLFLLPLMLKKQKRTRTEKLLQELNVQFREGLLAVSAALSAGYSVENAFGEALNDLYFLYPADCTILAEFRTIVNGISMNRNVEELLYAFADRSGLSDVQMFAEVFDICKRTGGDLVSVIQNTAARISEQIDVRREIETYLSAKKLEQRIMNVAPMAILLYVRLASPDFLNGIYKTVSGVLLMTVCLLVYGAAYVWSEHILRIAY